ncbi:MAG: hypothetical protein LBV08_09830 [Clostridiales bacterium]|jgi:hypothetical protein|nr:hypothetical protein [Clostridiales bacterium]
MNFKLEKNLKILNEILAYCFKKGCRDFDINIGFAQGTSVYKFCIDASQINDKDFQNLIQNISIDRQLDVEETFWELSGESSLSSEDQLPLVGLMVDDVTFKRDGSSIIFEVKRFEQEH